MANKITDTFRTYLTHARHTMSNGVATQFIRAIEHIEKIEGQLAASVAKADRLESRLNEIKESVNEIINYVPHKRTRKNRG